MTEDLARRCEHAIHVITPDRTVLRGGRASLYVMDTIGWHRFSALFSTRPLLWLVEATYWLVASHRQWFSRFLFHPEPRIDTDAAAPSPSAPPAVDVLAHERVAPGRPEGGDVRLDRLKLAVCLALAAGLVLAPTLWVSSRSYPLMPVWSRFPPIPFPLDYVVFVALLLLLGTAAVARNPGPLLAAILLIAGGLGALDQTRWQPWFYQYLVMLGALALYYWGRAQGNTGVAALNSCRVIMASVYLWSGLHKLNRSFIRETFPWFFQVLYSFSAETLELISWSGAAAPILEAGIGVGLMTARWRWPAMIGGILMHLFILTSLGPLGHNIPLVLAWNLAMIAFVVLLFRDTPHLRARAILSPRNGWYHVAVLTLFAVLPALSFIHLWDSYLSFAVFSGDHKRARIYVSDGLRGDLPSEVRAYVRKDDGGRNLLDILWWSNGELKVGTYPETRIFRRLGLYACGYAKAPTDVELVIEHRSLAAVWTSLVRLRLAPIGGSRVTSRYDCESLRQ